MKTITYQSKYYGIMRKLTFISLLSLSISYGQSISFTPAGQAGGFSKYNLTVSSASSVDGTGGFSMSGSSFAATTNYYIKVSFDGGVNWYPLTGGTATTGSWLGSGLFTTDGNGDVQIAFQHTRFSDLAAWPGNNGTISLRASNITQDTFYPGGDGSEFTLDLERPSISTSSITSNNGTNAEYATTGNLVSISFTSSEDLDNSDYPMTGNISGVSITPSGSGSSWTVSNTVSTHAEGTATFAISYYDENGNLGSSSLSTTTDGSTVTIDKTDPTLSVSIASNNSVTTLAKENNIVTLTINSDEILNTAPTVAIDGNAVTPNPNTASSSYSGLRTMESGDTQGTISISVTNIIDRAGNTATNITETTDASTVTFDSNIPTITGLTIESDNSLNSAYAKPNDIVTLTFYTNEECQTPIATVLTEATTESNASGDQLSWTATKQMDADDADGTVTFTINFYDLAGNQGTQATAVISGTNVTFDGTDPVVNSVTVASSNADATYAKAGDVVSVTIVTDEPLSSISNATVAGQSISGASISEISSTNWKLSYSVTGSESSGSVSYAFTAIDEAGNETSTTSAGSDVVIDNTAPTLTTSEIISNNSNTEYAKEGDVVTLTIVSAEDLIAAPTVYLAGRVATVGAVGGSATDYTATLTMNSTDTQGAMDISIAFTDLAGNDGTDVSTTTNNSSVYYDRQVPTLSSVTAASNNSNSTYAKEGDIVTISFTGAENLTSSPTVTIGGEAATVSGTDDTWSATYTMQNGDTEGNVTFTVDFSDLAGNSGTQVTALTSGSLVVYDQSTPTLSTVDITSSNVEASTLSTIGDIITLSITASENIQSPTVTIAGNAATIASGNNGESVFTATYTMQSSDAPTSEISFTVDFSDLAGNVGTQVTDLENDADGGVEFDKEAPTFTAVSIESDNAETALAKVGDEITVSLTANENIKTGADPTVVIAGNTATLTRNSNTSFSATYTMSSGDNAYDGLSIPINISNFSDPTGNPGITVTSTIDGSAVIFDMSTPTLGTVSIASDNVYSSYAAEGDIVTLTISSSEDLQTPTVSLVGSTSDVTVTQGTTASSWTATKTLTAGHTEGAIALSVTFSDLVGNSGVLVSAITTGGNVTYDKTSPTITTATMASDNSTDDILAVPGNTATLTFISSENIQEPTVTISGQSASVTTGADAQNWSASYQMTTNEDDGTIEFSISYTDSAGNAGIAHTTLVNDGDGSVTFDKTKPELSSITLLTDNSYDSGYAKTGSIVTLTFSANEQLLTSAIDVTIAGVSRSASKTASWDGTSETWAATYTMTDAYDDNGGIGKDVPFIIDYVDLNGYTGDQVTTTSSGNGVTFDKTAPTVSSLTIATDNANDASLCKVSDEVTITFVADELLQTPTIEIAGNGATETAGGTNVTWTGTYTMLAIDTEGEVSISVTYTDYAGNSGTTQTDITSGNNVTFDQTTPTLTAVSILSNNIYDSSLAKVGDQITLSITADETITDPPTFTIAGDAVVPTGAGTDWTGVYTMLSDDDAGTIAFSISFEDLAANAGVVVTTTVDGSSVTFDKTATDMSGVAVDLDSGSDTGVSSIDNLTNNTTPTFTMTGLVASDSIFLVIDGDTTARDKALTTTLSLTSTTLEEKVLGYSVSVVSRDVTGNVSTASPDITVRVDTNAPTISLTPNLLESDDSGFYSNDDITNSTQPYLVLAGLPSLRDSIRLFYDIGAGSVYCGAYRMGQATLDTVQVVTVLDDDDYSFSYVLIDSAGNVSSASANLDVTIDATSSAQPTAPNLLSAYDSGESSTDDLTNLTTIAFNVTGLTAGDSLFIIDGSSAVVSKEILEGTSSNPTVYNATTTTYAAYTKDIAGNQSITSESISVEIDQTAPDVTTVGIDLADDSDSGVSSTDDLTNDYTPEFTITNLTVTDSVYLYVDDVINQRSKATNSSLTFTADSLSDNTHVIAIRSKDLAGNLSLESTTTLTIRVDTTPPDNPSEAPNMIAEDDTGISDLDDTTYTVQPRFELSDLPSDLDSIRFFYDTGTGNVLSQSQRMSQGVTDTVQTSTNLSGNSYNFTYTIMDSAGNVSDASPILPIVVDITPPSVPNIPDLDSANDTGESNIDNLTNEERPGITVTGISSGYFSSLYFVNTNNDTTLITTETVPAEETVSYTTPILVSGEYTFYAIVADTAGNMRESADLSVSIDLLSPMGEISFESGDSLVRYEDVSAAATFVFSEEIDAVNAPTLDVDYPGNVAVDLTSQLLTNVDDTTWTYEIPLNAIGSEDMNGTIALTLNASDKAGNILLVGNTTGLDVLRVDNADPAYTFFTPDTGSYINTLTSFGWTLSETVDSASVVFESVSGPGNNVSVALSGIELSEGVHAPTNFIAGDPALSDSTVYNIIYTSLDTAGNEGNDTIANVTYDISKPIAIVTFDQLFASADSTDTIRVQFSEKVNPTPSISIDYGGSNATSDDLSNQSLTMVPGDSTSWYYPAVIPSGIENQGNVGIAVIGRDLATNISDSVYMIDTLYIDNTEAIATLTYSNLTQPSIGNYGIAGDTVVVTVSMNEPLVTIDPIPKLNISYGNGNGNTVSGITADSTSNGDSVWVYQIILQDTLQNDGILNVSITAKDRSNNFVDNYVNNTLFRVDNQHPADFEVGDVVVYGVNAAQGWINGVMDSMEVQIPIQTNTEDSTLFFGGYAQIQMYNRTRGGSWETIGSTDSLTQSGSALPYYRTIGDIETAMIPGTNLILGDSLELRASITDRYGNITYGTPSIQSLLYDPFAPVIGEFNGGNMFTMDTLFSNDTLSLLWTPFTESGDEAASGIDRYELAIEKVGMDSIHQFYGWDTVSYTESPLLFPLFLEHKQEYVGYVRSFDIAGNISDTLKTDTLTRYNTAPTISALINAVLYEDMPWSDTLLISDPDFDVFQGDSLTYKVITSRIIGAAATDSVSIDSVGVLSWQPTQNDTGTYEIEVIVTDAYALTDTFLLPLIVHAVNDTPNVDILSPDDALSWREDSGEMIQINLTSYLDDVDNNDTTDITWQVIILDTASLDEDYPLGQVIVGPGTSWHTQNKLAREYLGFNPKLGADLPIVSNKGRTSVEILSAANPLISVSMDMVNNELWATFASDSNYYGSNHRVIFIAQDLDGAEDRDTISVTVSPENDPPIIADIDDVEIWENTSISFDFGSFTTDVDDTSLTFTVSALTNTDFVTISPSTYLSHNEGDSVVITPQELWSDSTIIQVIASDEAISDTTTFEIDILRVERPAPSVAIVQNNAFANYLQVIIVDTVEKTTNITLNIQSEAVHLDTVAAYTWIANFDFEVAKSYSFDVFAQAEVGDTTWSNSFVLSFAQASERWFGNSSDGRFSVSGDPGSVLVDRNFVIVDSSLFSHHFTDRASYGMGDESYLFKNPVEVNFSVDRDDLAIYQRLNGVTWEELPTITKDGRLLTFTEKAGYFRKGPRTIIVPEETSLRQNYPNPFNPITNIVYDVGLLDGLRQNVSITVYNILGQHVATLVENHDQVGQFHVQWNGRDKFGQMLPTGIYFVQLRTDTGIVNNRKMMLMK